MQVGNSDSTNYCGSGPTSDDERSFSCSSEVSDVIEFLDAVSEEIISSSLSSASEVNTLDIVSDDVGTASDKEPSDVRSYFF